MPLQGYGVLVARVADSRREGGSDSPHYQVHCIDPDGVEYRIAVNVMSQQSPSDLLYLLDDDFQHPLTSSLADLAGGWHPLASAPGGPNLDYIRANLFDHTTMRLLPPDAAGPDNDLPDLLDHYVQRAIADPQATAYAFGQRWGPEDAIPDKVFGFSPGNGVHDIHMNQGNDGSFTRDDGVWQDGGLLLHFAAEPRWVAVFLAFQSQAWHTDDSTGHAIAGAEPAPPAGDTPAAPAVVGEPAAVRIVAALVNPAGPAPEAETVLLLNASPDEIDLTGWQLADRMHRTCAVPPGPLAAGATLTVALGGGVQLANSGGTITLLDSAGLKAAGVAYTETDARPQGWTITF